LGWGIVDWGFGPIPNPQSPIPNPQSPNIGYLIKKLIKKYNNLKLNYLNLLFMFCIF